MPDDFGSYQYEIYIQGLLGETPEQPLRLADLEALARERLDPRAWGYVAGGASSEDTMAENLAAFRRWRLLPRMLAGVAQRDVSTTVCGTELAAPVILAPIGVMSILHEEGELAVARAAQATGTAMCLSTAASNTIEDVADALGDTPRWFQLYWPADGELARSFVDRAGSRGYSAVVVTLDTMLLGWRPRDLNTAYLPFLQSEGIANYLSDPVFRASLDSPPEEDPGAAVMRWSEIFSDASKTWEDLAALVDDIDLPVLCKGVLSPQDARRAVDAGVSGIVVSNHGGRQVDGAIATLDALPAVVEEVGEEVDVVLDSGVRTGSDALKALALGAKAVMLGRPYTWGLAVGGQAGVEQAVKGFLADVDLALALSGHRSIAELGPDSMVRRSDAGARSRS